MFRRVVELFCLLDDQGWSALLVNLPEPGVLERHSELFSWTVRKILLVQHGKHLRADAKLDFLLDPGLAVGNSAVVLMLLRNVRHAAVNRG